MNEFRKKIRENPIVGGLIVTVLFAVFTRLLGTVFSLLPDNAWIGIIDELVSIAVMIAFVFFCGYGDVLRRPGIGKSVKVGLGFFLVYGLFLLSEIGTAVMEPKGELVAPLVMVQNALLLLGIGIREEVIFRGVIVNLFADKHLTDRKGLIYTVVMASAMFGVVHMGNAFHGVSILSCVVQSVVAMASGFVYCAIYLRSGSIWGPVLLHAVTDAAGLFSGLFYVGADATAVIGGLSIANLFPIIWLVPSALFLLRKKKMDEIFAVQRRNRG